MSETELYLQKQMSFGPRTPGSEAHQKFIDWATTHFQQYDWDVQQQRGSYNGHEVINILASKPSADLVAPTILLGAHYDCRLLSDQDPDPEKQKEPVQGANDGASGVAVLMELAAVLPDDLDKNVMIALFDAEDQGDIEGWDEWCIGSEMLASRLESENRLPDQMILLDMVGDRDLTIYREGNSDDDLTDEIWSIAAELGFENNFIDQDRYSMMDDHIPFVRRGVQSLDIIDFDYKYWHTSQDVLENVSENSLEIVGTVLYNWLTETGR